jgi:hypothetical protein
MSSLQRRIKKDSKETEIKKMKELDNHNLRKSPTEEPARPRPVIDVEFDEIHDSLSNIESTVTILSDRLKRYMRKDDSKYPGENLLECIAFGSSDVMQSLQEFRIRMNSINSDLRFLFDNLEI